MLLLPLSNFGSLLLKTGPISSKVSYGRQFMSNFPFAEPIIAELLNAYITLDLSSALPDFDSIEESFDWPACSSLLVARGRVCLCPRR